MNLQLQRRQFVRQATAMAAGACFAGIELAPAARAADEFTLAEFEKLHRALQPPADELWSTIPWKMDIVEGCNQAAKEKKPVLMRVRSGHPLGCV
ncbi:hypothetical protein AYO44_10065 [Planctomycetaceae bacterium SCGC AG-212-F19]|nr:hypothetical protein AYO44_10065 [Planctomycetaceae bacterium SCGC AG-212-F19]